MIDKLSAAPGKAERMTQYFFLIALVTVPFSTALTNTFVGLCYLSFLLTLVFTPALRTLPRFAPAILALVLLGLFLLGSTWSIAPHAEVMQALRKYSKLLLLPIGIALSWRDPTLAMRALRAFMAGAVVLATSCYLVWLNLMPTTSLKWWRIGNAHDAFAFKNHITVGILLGFAALICLLKASYPGTPGKRLAALAAGIGFCIPVIFLTQGRTGYLVMFIGLITLLLLRMRTNKVALLGGMIGVVALFIGFYAASANFKYRTDQFLSDVDSYKQANARTANGLRLSFFKVGSKVVAEHPLIGIGTGSFSEAYAPTARALWPSDSPEFTARNHAHSEFLGVAVQLGLLGTVVYVWMLAALGKATLRNRSFETDSLMLMWIIYVSTSVYNSLLWDPTEAHWFVLLAGCLYANNMRQPEVAQDASVCGANPALAPKCCPVPVNLERG